MTYHALDPVFHDELVGTMVHKRRHTLNKVCYEYDELVGTVF